MLEKQVCQVPSAYIGKGQQLGNQKEVTNGGNGLLV